MGEEKFIPKINKKINDFLYEEEGNISRGKILTVGSLLLIAGILFAGDVYAAHRSHSSHRSHLSHSSSAGGGHGSHESHQSHQSHQSGSGHSSHSSSTITHNSHSSTTVNSPTTPTVEPTPTFQQPQIPPETPQIR